MSFTEEKSRMDKMMDEADRKALEAEDPLLRLRQISGTNQVEKMRALLRNAKWVIPGMVLQGTIAQFYAKPNGGKTLFLMHSLIEQVKSGGLKGEDIYYVNEDDNFSGFLYKCELAKKYGFSMISSTRSEDENLRDPASILRVIGQAARSNNVDGKVFIFDTLKKFCSVMDKRLLPDFFAALRSITAGNGTVILPGHANKYLDNDGKLIFEGVADIQNDIDIQYAIYNLSERTDERQLIRFLCEKDRGDIEMERFMEYRKEPGMHYEAMIDSLKIAEGETIVEVDRKSRRRDIHEMYEFEVPWILDNLKPGMEVKKTDFVMAGWQEMKDDQKSDPGSLAAKIRSRDKLSQAVEALIGHDLRVQHGNKGAKLLSRTDDDSYTKAKYGE